MTFTDTRTAAPAAAPAVSVLAALREPTDVVDAYRARWEAGTVNGLWPDTDDEAAPELLEDPAADRLGWDQR